ncbi:hypothetical protein GCM10010503_14440 [Streptomyces lucensis JCM 4490]|uniref:DUF2330 domain-containing protein n=1 Tax=Streptomyces lucensis JCM 4490 TaxID=1306176 RepID=A0A918IYT3_9ACTN|nr:DUF2330 domain-containing protein [Streptomyces lucensis]GGW39280.1 hypothetical protein GCM10010503_14440 [Streptomyces lucensis JCM 4490]
MTRARIVSLLLALLGIQLTWFIAPAYACGCGAMVPDPAARIAVSDERSVLRWDGRREDIVMRLTVDGDAHHAAWIMPVPHRATVRLGDPAVFGQLAHAMAPVHRTRYHFWPHDGEWPFDGHDEVGDAAPPPAAGAVSVVGRQRLGPFDVARLTATDPAALGDWLHAHGFALPARLKTALQPYVDRHWEYVAVRLAPDTSGAMLHGALDPLHLTFAADRPVYPMRLSRLAGLPQSLGLYVLAAHRMETRTAIGGLPPEVVFAGRLTTHDGALGELASGTPYLTAFTQRFPDPRRISGDHELRRAAADTPVQQVIYDDELRRIAGIPAWLLTTAGGLLVVVAAVAVAVVRRSRRPVPPPPPVEPPPPLSPSVPVG